MNDLEAEPRTVHTKLTVPVVVFSILVQGLTVRRVLVHYGVGETSAS